MKISQKQKHHLLLASLCLIGTASVQAAHGSYKPYIGFDFQERRMAYKDGYGDNLLNAAASQGNVYVGAHLRKHLAVELGFEETKTKSRTATLYTGDVAAGIPVQAGVSPIVFKSTANIKGPHLNLVWLQSFVQDPAFKLFGSVGVGLIRGTFTRTTLTYGPLATPGTSPARLLSRNQAVLRLAGGVEYRLWKHLATRIGVSWLNTRRITAPSKDSLVPLEFKPRDTVAYGVGLLWKF